MLWFEEREQNRVKGLVRLKNWYVLEWQIVYARGTLAYIKADLYPCIE